MNPRFSLPLPEIEQQLSTVLAPAAVPSFYSLPSSVQIADKSGYKLGSVYGMDLASGLSVHVLDVRPGQSVLDLCAAPGNKLAMIADAMSAGAAEVASVAATGAASSSAAASAAVCASVCESPAASSAACASPAPSSSPSLSGAGSVVGVDWSYSRLAATRTMMRKYKHSAAHVQLYLADGQTFERPRRSPQQIRTAAVEQCTAAAAPSSRRATELQIIDLTQQPRPASSADATIASSANFHVAGSADSSVWRMPAATAAAAASSSANASSAAAAFTPPVILRMNKREKRLLSKEHKRAAWEKKRKREEGLEAEDTTTTAAAGAAAADAALTESKPPDSAAAPINAPVPFEPELYDRVLVDAECTHDGAHKHMLAIAQAEAREAAAAGTTAGDSTNLTSAANAAASGDSVQAASAAASPSPSPSPQPSTPSSAATWSAFTARYFSASRLSSLQVLQRALLRNGFRLLRPGGVLVYSTCSFLRRQNEDIVEWLLTQEPQARAVQVWEGVAGAGPVERVDKSDAAAAEVGEQSAATDTDAHAGLFRVSLRSDLPTLTFRVAPNPYPHAQPSSPHVPLGIRLSPWASGTSGLFIAKITKMAD